MWSDWNLLGRYPPGGQRRDKTPAAAAAAAVAPPPLPPGSLLSSSSFQDLGTTVPSPPKPNPRIMSDEENDFGFGRLSLRPNTPSPKPNVSVFDSDSLRRASQAAASGPSTLTSVVAPPSSDTNMDNLNWNTAMARSDSQLAGYMAAHPTEQNIVEAKMNLFLWNNPLEAVNRRRPFAERRSAEAAKYSSLEPYGITILSEIASGVEATTYLIERSQVEFVMRVSKTGDTTGDTRDVAKHVLMERLRERYPQAMRNVIQMVDYQRLQSLDMRRYGDTYQGERIIQILEKAGVTLMTQFVDMVKARSVQTGGINAFLISTFTQLFCQLHYLHLFLNEFEHWDLHWKNIMFRPAYPLEIDPNGHFDYVIQIAPGTTDPNGTSAPSFRIHVPTEWTNSELVKIIDLGWTKLRYHAQDPSSGATTEQQLNSAKMERNFRPRDYRQDALLTTHWFVEFCKTHFTAEKDLLEARAGRILRGLARLSLKIQNIPDTQSTDRFLVANLLRTDPFFQSVRDPVTSATPVDMPSLEAVTKVPLIQGLVSAAAN